MLLRRGRFLLHQCRNKSLAIVPTAQAYLASMRGCDADEAYRASLSFEPRVKAADTAAIQPQPVSDEFATDE